MDNKKVAVLMGGVSSEREISLLSGQGVLKALQQVGVNAYAFDPAEQDLTQLKKQGFSACFNVLHGRLGEDGCVQGALEWLDIPYTGSGVLASAIAMDKKLTKTIWQRIALPMAKDRLLYKRLYGQVELEEVVKQLGLPLIVKPNAEGSSIGVTIVHNLTEFSTALEVAFAKDNAVICESFIKGKELSCVVLGSGENAYALPVIWIEPPSQQAYDYNNKYFTDTVKYHIPAQLSEQVELKVRELAVKAYRELGCRGWGRVDFMLDQNNQPYLLEINLAPGMTEHSLVPKAARQIGIDYQQLCVDILAMATTDNRLKFAKI